MLMLYESVALNETIASLSGRHLLFALKTLAGAVVLLLLQVTVALGSRN